MKLDSNFTLAARFASVWAAGLIAISVHGGTVTLHPVADTTLFEPFPDNNLGTSLNMAAGATAHGQKSRALIKFDLTGAIPTNANVTTVTCTVSVTKTPGNGGVTSVFDLRRGLRSWAEGSRLGAGETGIRAVANEATWKARFFPATLWNQPGGDIGSDFALNASAFTGVSGIAKYSFHSTPGLVADVQAWVSDPTANFGWVLMSQSENTAETARRFGSREDSANAPSLVIDYSVLTALIQMAGIMMTNSVATLSWTGGTPPFQLQQKGSMNDTNWIDVGAPLTNSLAKINASGRQSFFRIRQITP